MANVELGTAYVTIAASTRNFARDISAALGTAGKEGGVQFAGAFEAATRQTAASPLRAWKEKTKADAAAAAKAVEDAAAQMVAAEQKVGAAAEKSGCDLGIEAAFQLVQ